MLLSAPRDSTEGLPVLLLSSSASVFLSFFQRLAILLTTAVFLLGPLAGSALTTPPPVALLPLGDNESLGLFNTPDEADLALAVWC